MHNRLTIIFIVCLLQSLTATAQMHENDSVKRGALADSINRAAESADFIHAYIDIATPGDKVYSCFGHSAIRLTCPSKGLDFCFTFEIDMEESGVWDFVTHKAKAGFAAAPTIDFLKQYRDAGRGVTQYELNLKPHEKQNLWKRLDEEVGKGPCWTFDFYTFNCSSMVLWAIECSLDSAQLSFPHVPECLNGDYHDAVSYMSTQSPWYGLIWHMIIIDGGPNDSEISYRMAPKMMAESLPFVKVVGNTGVSYSLLIGEPQKLFAATYIDTPCAFRPWMAAVIILIIIICAIFLKYKRKRNKGKKKTK